MSTLVLEAMTLASQILQVVNTQESLKYVKELEKARMDLVAEEQNGYASDDAKIEALHAQIGVLLQAVNHVFQIYRTQAVATPPTTH